MGLIFDRLSFRGTSIQTPSIYFDIVSGYFDGIEVSGRDVLVPGVEGMWETARERRRRKVVLEGWTRGIGATLSERQESWHDASQALAALLDLTLSSGPLQTVSGYLGSPTGAELECRTVNVVSHAPDALATFQVHSVELVAIGDLDWAAGSS